MSKLTRALAIAREVHAEQVDKGGHPYIEHPLRVMAAVSDPDAKIVAVLHDVVEDSRQRGAKAWTLERLRAEGFSALQVAGIDAVTRREGESYMDFVRRAGEHPLGRLVKLADLRDNMDLTRIPTPTARDQERLERYQKAMALLLPAAQAKGPQA